MNSSLFTKLIDTKSAQFNINIVVTNGLTIDRRASQFTTFLANFCLPSQYSFLFLATWNVKHFISKAMIPPTPAPTLLLFFLLFFPPFSTSNVHYFVHKVQLKWLWLLKNKLCCHWNLLFSKQGEILLKAHCICCNPAFLFLFLGIHIFPLLFTQNI